MPLKPFKASFYDSWAFGGWTSIELVVVANTESEALGLALEKYTAPELKADLWSIEEIDLSSVSVEEVYSGGT